MDEHDQPRASLRVVHIVHWLSSGLGAIAGGIISQHKTAGVKSYLVVLDGIHPEHVTYGRDAETVLQLSFSSSPLQSLERLRQFLRDVRPQVLHSHSLTPMLLATLLSGGSARRIRTVHSEYPYLSAPTLRSAAKRTLERFLMKRQAKVVVVSEDLVQPIEAVYPPRPECIPNGISISPSACSARSAGAELGDRTPVLAAVGRLCHQKGFDLLLEAVADVRRGGMNVTLLIAGEGELERELRAQAVRLGIQDAVDFSGFTNDIAGFFGKCDLFVSSSRYEGFALVTMEALAMGLPVITTPTAGAATIIRKNQWGLVTEEASSAALSAAIVACLRDLGLARSKALSARKELFERYSVERMAADYLRAYQ